MTIEKVEEKPHFIEPGDPDNMPQPLPVFVTRVVLQSSELAELQRQQLENSSRLLA